MSNIYWTKEEEEKLTKLVNEGKTSFRMMEKEFPIRTRYTIKAKAGNMGLVAKYKKHTYVHNVDFWNQINPVTAYFAGFSMGDACLSKKQNKGVAFRIGINSKDVNLLYKFKEVTGYTGKITISKPFHKMCNRHVDSAKITVSGCYKWFEDMEKYWGLIPNKTFRASPPIINDDYLKLCWLIGMIDADGCLTKKPKETGIKLSIVSCNTKILEYCKEILDRLFPELPNTGGGHPKLTRINQTKGTNTHVLDVSNIRAFIIVDYLRQFPLPKFSRKWSKSSIIQALEECKQKYPHLFYRKLEIPEQYKQYSMPDTPIYIPAPQSLISQTNLETPISINNQTLVTT